MKPSEKQEVRSTTRSQFLKARAGVTDRISKEKAIAQQLLPFLAPGLKIAAYIPIKDEVNIFQEICSFLQTRTMNPKTGLPETGRMGQNPAAGFEVQDPVDESFVCPSLLVPKVVSRERMIFLPCIRLRKSRWGILEPEISEDQSPEIVPDLLIVPLAGFDGLHRMGYGGGYYDRWLQKHPHSVSIGIAFDEQKGTIVPQPWDVDLDCILTPSKIMEGPQFRKKIENLLKAVVPASSC